MEGENTRAASIDLVAADLRDVGAQVARVDWNAARLPTDRLSVARP
jgi:hypothetical protein